MLTKLKNSSFSQNEFFHATEFSEVVSFKCCFSQTHRFSKNKCFNGSAVAKKRGQMFEKTGETNFLEIIFMQRLSLSEVRV